MPEVQEVPSYIPFKGSKSSPKRRSTLKRTKRPKVRTNLSLADEAFSKRILARDGKCLFPDCVSKSQLTCSHYVNRGKFATRFDEKNCITLCQYHHYMSRVLGWEFQKQRKEKHGWDGQYTLFMREWLGEGEFQALLIRGSKTKKQSVAIREFMETAKPPIRGGQE